MSKVTYKGIELGKSANEYSQVQVSELVALYMKNHCDNDGVYLGTVRSALEDMFGYEWDHWEKKIRTIAQLIKYIGYKPGRDGNGREIWRVPDEELMGGGVRVKKDIPEVPTRVTRTPKKKESIVETQVQERPETKTEKPAVVVRGRNGAIKSGIPDGLRKNIQERSSRMWTCTWEGCGRVMKEIARGPHMRQHYKNGLSENGAQVLEAIETFPGSGIQTYEDALGWSRSKVRSALSMLRRRGLIEASGRSVATRYYSLRTDKDRGKPLEVVSEAPKPTRKQKPKESAPREAPSMKPTHGMETMSVIRSVDGSLFYVSEGKLYKVTLEEVDV